MKKEILICTLAVSVLTACVYNPRTGKEYVSDKNTYTTRSSTNRAYRYAGVDAPLYEGSRTKFYNKGCDYGNFPTPGSGCGEDYHAVTGQTIWPVQAPVVQGYGATCSTCGVVQQAPVVTAQAPCVSAACVSAAPIQQTFTVPVQVTVSVPPPVTTVQQTTTTMTTAYTAAQCASCTSGACLNQCVKVYSPNDFYGRNQQSSPTIINNVSPVPYNQVPGTVQGNVTVGQ